MLERLFGLQAHGTTVRREVVAGLTTFLTMAYILFVNPDILKATGMDPGAVFVATCVAAAYGTLVMGFYANYPVALAPGMGLNAYFAFAVVLGQQVSWQVALGAVFLSGVLFTILSVLPFRAWIINSIPRSLKMAIGAGIGFFLAIIALNNAGIIVDHPATLVTVGDLTSAPALYAIAGFVLMLALDAMRVPGAVLIGILAVTVAAMLFGDVAFLGLADVPPDPTPTLFQLDIVGAFEVGLVTVVFTFLLVDLFDTAGTLIGVSHRAGLLDEKGRLPRIGRALLADSSATMVGALAGTSTTTSYIESAAGIKAGGRTGLTAVTVGALFLLALFFSPLALSVPAFATAPALLFVACLMARGMAEIDWEDVTESAPAVVTAIAMPLTYSIAHGIGIGFIVYALGKLLSGRWNQLHPVVLLVAALFVVKFALL